MISIYAILTKLPSAARMYRVSNANQSFFNELSKLRKELGLSTKFGIE